MEKNLTVKETFDLAVKSYQKKKFQVVEKFYKEILHPTCQKCQSQLVKK